MLSPGQYTHHPRCPHLIATLQRVVDDVAMPMWMPSPCSGTSPILVRGPGGPRAGAAAAPAPQVEVYPTQYGNVVQVIMPLTIYETVQALGYHHLGDLYTGDHRVKQDCALKERAPTRKGIPGLREWLTRHGAVLVPPAKGAPAAMAGCAQGLDPGRRAHVPGGRGHRRTSGQNHPSGDRVPQGTTPPGDRGPMQDTMEAANWVPELRVCHQPPDTLPSDTRLHRLLVALLGIQVQVNAPLHAQLWDDHHHVSLARLQRTGVWAPTIVWMNAPPTDTYWRWAQTSQAPLVTVTTALPPFPWIAIAPGAVARFKYPVECVAHKCPGHPSKGPLYYSLDVDGNGAGGAQPGPAHPSPGAPWGLGPLGAARPGYRPPECANPRGSARLLVPRPACAGYPPRYSRCGGCGGHAGRHVNGRSRSERARGLLGPRGLRVGHLPGRGGYDPPLIHPKAGIAARSILAGTGLGSGSGGPPHVPSGGPLWRCHPPPLRSSPGGRTPLPGVRHQRGYHAVALDNGPQRPRGCGDAGAAGSGPNMAPPPPLLLPPPGALPRPVSALPDSAGRLVAGSGCNTGAGRL